MNLSGEGFEGRPTLSVQSNHIPSGAFNTEMDCPNSQFHLISIVPSGVEEVKQFYFGCCPCSSKDVMLWTRGRSE